MPNNMLVTIYAEATPNPASMKFVLNDYLVPEEGDSLEFRTMESAKGSPLAQKLFSFPFVRSVFIAANFVTVTQDESLVWYDIIPDLKDAIKNHILEGGKVVDSHYVPEVKPEAIPGTIELKIKEVLDEYVRPAVEGDGGAIELKSFDKGTVTVVLRGSCSGCPSSSLTLKAGIENLLRRMVPEVEEVIAESV